LRVRLLWGDVQARFGLHRFPVYFVIQSGREPSARRARRVPDAAYNKVNEFTKVAGQPLVYDANGDLASDGQRNYFWDAENRLAPITYMVQPVWCSPASRPFSLRSGTVPLYPRPSGQHNPVAEPVGT
jgi:hypothetical protein